MGQHSNHYAKQFGNSEGRRSFTDFGIPSCQTNPYSSPLYREHPQHRQQSYSHSPSPFHPQFDLVCHLKPAYISQDPTASLTQGIFDPYASSPSMATSSQGQPSGQINPYLHDQAANGGGAFYSGNPFLQPLNYHLYVSQAPYRDHLTPNQRTARDFFISDNLREELQRKSAATVQTLPRTYIRLVWLSSYSQQNPPCHSRSITFIRLSRWIRTIRRAPPSSTIPAGFTKSCRREMVAIMLFDALKVYVLYY